MIYQCLTFPEHREKCFTFFPYEPFGLTPQTNERVASLLSDPIKQQQLNEYGAMIWHYLNPTYNKEPWIGFTSWRQLEKTDKVFTKPDLIDRLLHFVDIIGFGKFQFYEISTKREVTLYEQAEGCHPGINQFIMSLLNTIGYNIFPVDYLTLNHGIYCNYWIMSVRNFQEYMHWSYPMIQLALNNLDHPYLKATSRQLGYVAERLFILWYMYYQKRIVTMGDTCLTLCKAAEKK